MSQDQEQPFIAAIRDHPHDDGHRLAYADWLEERGDDDRAHFIRSQCWAEDPKLSLLMRRKSRADADAILARHEKEWVQPLFDLGAIEVSIYRGLPHIVITVEQFLKNADRLFQSPLQLQSVRLTDTRHIEQVQRLANCRHLERLTELDLSYNGIGDAGAAALASSPHLYNLTTLNLGFNNISAVGAVQLARSQHLYGLTSLNLRCNDIGAAGAMALADSEQLRKLSMLELSAYCCGNVVREVHRKMDARRRLLADSERSR